MNKHDSERVKGLLESEGSIFTDSIDDADIVVFLTCCVRESAENRALGHISSVKGYDLRPGSPIKRRIVAVGGCVGQRDGEDLKDRVPQIDVVFGPNSIDQLPALIDKSVEDNTLAFSVPESTTTFSTELPTNRDSEFSAWLPITVGCNNFCSYCIVPYVRGREKSRTIEDIVAEAEKYVESGVKEITLLGQNVNSYGRDLYGTPHFSEVLDKVSATGIERLRFATSHPKDLTDEVISKFASLDNLMPALHLPVQAGSDKILADMNRRYTAEHYLGLISKLRQACPEIALSTDIIVGFPGETEEDFQCTYDLVKEVGYTQVFTFIFSPRSGTPAAKMDCRVPRDVVQDRFDRLFSMVEKGAYEANQAYVGKMTPVLIEGTSKKDSKMITGRSPQNINVHAPAPEGLSESFIGQTVNVLIEEAKTWYLRGRLV